MNAVASKRSANDSASAPERKISELEPSTRRIGNYVEILGDFKPLTKDFVPSNLAKESKKPVR
jgi:hypothetical protein